MSLDVTEVEVFMPQIFWVPPAQGHPGRTARPRWTEDSRAGNVPGPAWPVGPAPESDSLRVEW
jgi:hypothetical protein